MICHFTLSTNLVSTRENSSDDDDDNDDGVAKEREGRCCCPAREMTPFVG